MDGLHRLPDIFREARTAQSCGKGQHVRFSPLTDADVEHLQTLPDQAQAEELLDRAIQHDPRALELFEQNIGGWSKLTRTARIGQLDELSRYSTDLRVRYANVDLNLALNGLAKTDASTDEALDQLFDSFTHDPSNAVRDRAGCNVSDCGTFKRKQRMQMVPKLIELAADPGTTPQMRNWTFLALHEITDETLPADASAWQDWYTNHGAEKMAEFEQQDWWRVRGDQ
jgi:hypothetical protein